MGRLILTHQRNEGAHIEGKGLILDVIVQEISFQSASVEIRGLGEPETRTIGAEQPETEIAPGLRLEWSRYDSGRVSLAYNAEPVYYIERRTDYGLIKVLAHKIGQGARIMGNSFALDLIVREIGGTKYSRWGKVELQEGSKFDSFRLKAGDEPLALREGLSIRLGKKQSGRLLRIVYLLDPKYKLQRRDYTPETE